MTLMLITVKRLVEKYKYTNKVYDIGFSGHHKGIAFDIAAYTLKKLYRETFYLR